MTSAHYVETPSRQTVPAMVGRGWTLASPKVPTVTAGIGYAKAAAEPHCIYMYEPADGTPQDQGEYDVHEVPITDARSSAVPPSLAREGFELWDAPSAVQDFTDAESIVAVYYAEAMELALEATGARYAHVFDHKVRQRERGRPPLTFGRHGDGSRPAAVGRAHNDYTEASGLKRLGLVLKDPEAVAQVSRYGVVNIWRSIQGPVLDTPLAVCDARTVSAADLVEAEIRYPTRTGRIYLLKHAPRHRWSYFSAMDRHEALIFKQYDSQASGVARYTPHAAFDHPDTPPEAPLRESIEIRCLVVYE